MAYLNADGKYSFQCVWCRKIKKWYEFPIKESTRLTNHAKWDINKDYNVPKKRMVCFNCVQRELSHKIFKLSKMAENNNMTGLREKLFETIEGLKEKTVTVGEAKAICEVAQVIINSVKVEVDYLRAIGSKKGGDFIQIEN